jgi:hypothetical protein
MEMAKLKKLARRTVEMLQSMVIMMATKKKEI